MYASIFYLYTLADNKGRWWIIGSAWKGDEQKNTNIHQKKDMYDKKLLDMAKKYRMNTDTRKNIFCILFTAEVCLLSMFTFYKKNLASIKLFN